MTVQFQKALEQQKAMAAREKKRLVLLLIGFAVVAIGLGTTLKQALSSPVGKDPVAIADESAEPQESILAVPELDLARLEALVQDATPEERVVLESEAVDLVLDSARRYTPRHFAALGTRELDAALCQELLADPAAARGKPFTARGRIVALRPRTGAAHEAQTLGRLELEDGSAVHFLALELPEDAESVGGFVRLDGLFLKLYSTEDELAAGTWNEGPLLVGSRLQRSYPSLGTLRTLPPEVFAEVEDANLAPDPGREISFVTETPFEPFWTLMAFARDGEDAIDWNEMPVLDQRLLDQIQEDPVTWRLQPVVLPISRLQDGRVSLGGENPARMERYMQGWIGNNTWKGVIQFRSPVLHSDFKIGELVQGRGFFLHNFAYEASQAGLCVAPVFVLSSIERFVPEPNPTLGRIGLFVGAVGAVLVAAFVVLTRRDRRRSEEFQKELLRRRRARSSKGLTGSTAP